jgi:hypothetical protein
VTHSVDIRISDWIHAFLNLYYSYFIHQFKINVLTFLLFSSSTSLLLSFSLLPSPSSGCRASQRLLLSVPDAAVILSATMWGGVGALNTPKITDISRHPFDSTAVTSTSAAAETGGKKGLTTGPPVPVLALCTQLIDLNQAGDGESSLPLIGDSCSCCVYLNEDTIQIITQNLSVHVFRLQSDLKAITHNRENRLIQPEASPVVFKLLKTMVGFGWGKGGAWVRVGYITAGAATRGQSPLSLLGSPWKGPPKVAADSCVAPFAASLSLFQSLSPLPDIPIANVTAPVAKAAVSAFSMGGSSATQRDSSSSGFGFGFGMMSKLRAAEPVDRSTGSGIKEDSRDPKNDSLTRNAYLSSLVARFESVFRFTEAAAADMLAARRAAAAGQKGGAFSRSYCRDQHHNSKEFSSLVVATLDSIDDDPSSGRASSDDLTSKRTAIGPSVGLLAELRSGLQPTVQALLRSRTSEESAGCLQAFTLLGERRVFSCEDVVLMYVHAELLGRLCLWCTDSTDILEGEDQDYCKMSSVIAAKLVSLDLDESAVNCLLGSMCDSILAGVTPVEFDTTGKAEIKQSNGTVIDELLRTDTDSAGLVDFSTESGLGSGPQSVVPPKCMGGVSVMNCLVSSNQGALCEIFVLSVMDKWGNESQDMDMGGGMGLGMGVNAAETPAERSKEKRKAGLLSISGLIGLGLAQDTTSGPDVFALLARSRAALWLVDITPLGDLIGRLALQQFKAKKDSMDVFLEMVLAGQTDKLFLLAKADRNNSGTLQDMHITHSLIHTLLLVL